MFRFVERLFVVAHAEEIMLVSGGLIELSVKEAGSARP